MSENDTPKPKQLEVIDVVVGQKPTLIKWDDMTEEQQDYFARVAATRRVVWSLNNDPLALICEVRCDMQMYNAGAIQHLDTNEHIKFLERAEELLRTVGYKSHVG